MEVDDFEALSKASDGDKEEGKPSLLEDGEDHRKQPLIAESPWRPVVFSMSSFRLAMFAFLILMILDQVYTLRNVIRDRSRDHYPVFNWRWRSGLKTCVFYTGEALYALLAFCQIRRAPLSYREKFLAYVMILFGIVYMICYVSVVAHQSDRLSSYGS